jgi:cellulose biosynthesis protein BcsQ
LEQLKKFIKNKKLKHLELIPFFSMADRRKKMQRDIMETLVEKHNDILPTAIPNASDIERMGLERMPLGAYVHKGRSQQAYQSLWEDIIKRVKEV